MVHGWRRVKDSMFSSSMTGQKYDGLQVQLNWDLNS